LEYPFAACRLGEPLGAGFDRNPKAAGAEAPVLFFVVISAMPFHRNFTYWFDKRAWKYIFLLKTLELSGQ
jgi:hypothetical protein